MTAWIQEFNDLGQIATIGGSALVALGASIMIALLISAYRSSRKKTAGASDNSKKSSEQSKPETEELQISAEALAQQEQMRELKKSVLDTSVQDFENMSRRLGRVEDRLSVLQDQLEFAARRNVSGDAISRTKSEYSGESHQESAEGRRLRQLAGMA